MSKQKQKVFSDFHILKHEAAAINYGLRLLRTNLNSKEIMKQYDDYCKGIDTHAMNESELTQLLTYWAVDKDD